MRVWPFVFVSILPAVLAAQPAEGPRLRWRGYVAAEPRVFPQDAGSPQQDRLHGSLAAELELRHESADRKRSLVVTPFLRLDGNDSRRSHLDLREAAIRMVTDDFELLAGVSKVFWGVTESQHLVDIVNQTDLVENPDGEDKLGQVMVNLTVARRWGTLNLFVLPLSRERTFPGDEGRPRLSLPVDGDASVFEGGRWRPSVAARWSKTLGLVDLGLSHFYGTSREPRLAAAPHGDGVRLVPHYDLVHQTGLDAQVTAGRWLWKLEAIRRSGHASPHLAATAGFEYSLANAGGLGFDLGLLAEYLYDERGRRAPTPWQDDIFFGARVAPNDAQGTELLAGVIVDRRTRSAAWSLEGSRRIGAHWRVGVEARAFRAAQAEDPLAEWRRDGYVQTELSYRF
jgi:hypothetical protein